jgi:hypothetical protein
MREDTALQTEHPSQRPTNGKRGCCPTSARATVQGSGISLTISKQTRKHFLIYGKRPFFTSDCPPLSPSQEKKKLIATHMQTESPVNHRKQTTGVHSNRYQTSAQRASLTARTESVGSFHRALVSHLPFSLLYLPILIATVPRLEIAVTLSFKRRKHFLTATRNAFSCTASILPVYSKMTHTNTQYHQGGEPDANSQYPYAAGKLRSKSLLATRRSA